MIARCRSRGHVDEGGAAGAATALIAGRRGDHRSGVVTIGAVPPREGLVPACDRFPSPAIRHSARSMPDFFSIEKRHSKASCQEFRTGRYSTDSGALDDTERHRTTRKKIRREAAIPVRWTLTSFTRTRSEPAADGRQGELQTCDQRVLNHRREPPRPRLGVNAVAGRCRDSRRATVPGQPGAPLNAHGRQRTTLNNNDRRSPLTTCSVTLPALNECRPTRPNCFTTTLRSARQSTWATTDSPPCYSEPSRGISQL